MAKDPSRSRAKMKANDADRAIGRRIEAARELRGMTKVDVYRETGIHPDTVGYTERGRRRIPARDLALLCEALDCSPDLLLGLEPRGISGANETLARVAADLSLDVLRLETENGALRDRIDELLERVGELPQKLVSR